MPDRPTLSQGDTGPNVTYLQQQLNSDNSAGLATDGDFGPATESAVMAYQSSRRLDVDGVVGPQTWNALETDAPPLPPPIVPGLPPPLTQEQINAIKDIAANSAIAKFNWSDRGVAPKGYTKGVACTYANVYRQWQLRYAPATEMAEGNTHNENYDVLSWEAGRFASAGLPIEEDGVDTLRSLWAYILGLGMRESSGGYCVGRDMSVPPGYYGPESTTTEAGAWQTSYDASGCSPNFNVLFHAYQDGGGQNPQGLVDVYKEGVSCSSANWACYGSGDGYDHQWMSKNFPAYAAEVCATTLRNLRKHYGPVGRREVQIRREAYDMLKAVEDYIDSERGDATGV